MSEQDLRELRAFLKEAVQASRRTRRDLERALGVGSGKLDSLFDGSRDLRIRHLLAVAELLSVPPEDLLAFTCSAARQNAKHRITDWLPRLRRNGDQQGQAPSGSLDQLKELVRAAVQEELGAQGLAPEKTRPRGPRTRAR